MKRMIGLTAVLAIAGLGCGDDDGDGTDIMIDFGMPDMGSDSGTETVDSGIDGGTPVCSVGEACTAVRGCRSADETCIEDSLFGGSETFELGGPDDPILNNPDGEETPVPGALFPGGYCTNSFPFDVTTTACTPNTDEGEAFCGECATCINLFGTEDPAEGVCLTSCEPNLTDNSDCRDGYECLLTQEACFTGCLGDTQCRVSREDNNGVPGIQTPGDCMNINMSGGDPANCTPADCGETDPADPEACDNPGTNFDNLVYDTESEAVCNPDTFRCEGAPSDPAASGGDPCTVDSECEAEGFCIAEDPDDGSWAGGSCTKFRCDIAGNECANDGVCQEAGVGVFACFEGCTVGGYDTTSEPSTWVVDGSAQDTCRDGYGCFWGGTAAGGTEDNGVCLPIEYSEAVTEPNIGAACTEDSDCFSPFGNGFCITGDAFPNGYCSVRNCAAPWFTEGTPEDQNVCGGDDICVSFDMDDPTFALCLQDCSTADDCTDGLGCVELSAGGPQACFNCQTDAECRDGERCSMTQGLCVPE